ncbi:uncharacterized protein LOC111714530 isoform X2 [Eurytemora carolleeae]|uniref:uncharacterized protein LOC111714530 isoform X2 n=1 Tax=Eurytemora carolleeae TaxID=1294199 RepID=UPI000C75C684|nr:uncharacterized protein LOC111714530 isoform X2 [Eurytemora carolleeae]|eukprot:XP_023345441.1 uncharacterized protein LOC111714530 isoform X2 [Eurytemora affinis]
MTPSLIDLIMTRGVIFLLLSCSVIRSQGEISDTEMIRNLEIALEKTRMQLETCQSKLESSSKSFMGQAISGLGSLGTCLANPPERPFKPFVSEMLRILELETHSGVVPPRSLEFSTSAQELQTLRRFILHDDIKFAEVQKRLILVVMFCYCIVHTWLGEYWKAVAKKEAILAKHGPNMKNCRLENRGMANSITDFFSGLFNGKDDPCEEYYRAALVDPAFEVNLVHALVESVSQLLGVLGGLGHALGHFVNNFLAPLPLIWKIPALVVGAVVLILGFLALSGYQLSTLFFTFGPARPNPSVKGKAKPRLRASKSKSALQEPETESKAETQSLKFSKISETDAWRQPLPYPSEDSNNLLHTLVHQPSDPRPSYKH